MSSDNQPDIQKEQNDFIISAGVKALMRNSEFRKKHDIANWNFDGGKGVFKLTLNNGVTLEYQAQIAATWNSNKQSFMWGWANGSLPQHLTQGAQKACEIATERQWDVFTTPKLECDENTAWSLVSAVGELTGLTNAYRGSAGSGVYVYFIFNESEASSELPQQNEEQEDETKLISTNASQGFQYELYVKMCVIVKYEGEDEELTIPRTFEGRPVKGLDYAAFSGSVSLKSVVIPEGVEFIGAYCFENCSNLETIKLPNSLQEIETGAFGKCTSLHSVILPPKLKVVSDRLFDDCYNLTSIILPEDLTDIQSGAFMGCRSLEKLRLPSKATTLEDLLFVRCNSLVEFIVDKDNSAFCSIDGVLYSRDKKTLVAVPPGTEGDFCVPNGVTEIEDYAFNTCKFLTSIEMPETVDIINHNALQACSSLVKVVFPKNASRICMFDGCISLTEVNIPNGIKRLWKYMFSNCEKLRKVVVPKSVETIEENVFCGCENVTIYSYNGSLAEKYAVDNSIPFVAIE